MKVAMTTEKKVLVNRIQSKTNFLKNNPLSSFSKPKGTRVRHSQKAQRHAGMKSVDHRARSRKLEVGASSQSRKYGRLTTSLHLAPLGCKMSKNVCCSDLTGVAPNLYSTSQWNELVSFDSNTLNRYGLPEIPVLEIIEFLLLRFLIHSRVSIWFDISSRGKCFCKNAFSVYDWNFPIFFPMSFILSSPHVCP